jgi:hypothetical protein
MTCALLDLKPALRLDIHDGAYLRPLQAADVTTAYADGLNDPKVHRYMEAPRKQRQTLEDVRAYVAANAADAHAILFGLYVVARVGPVLSPTSSSLAPSRSSRAGVARSLSFTGCWACPSLSISAIWSLVVPCGKLSGRGSAGASPSFSRRVFLDFVSSIFFSG